MIGRINPEFLREKLRHPLPGVTAQAKMAPANRALARPAGKCRQAAVMLLLFPEEELVRLVLIRRNEYDGPHSGQVSFPGAVFEEEDRTLERTAIRETAEELGITISDTAILGQLTPLYIPVSNFCVTPYVGWSPGKPDFHPDKEEVQYLIMPSLEELADPFRYDTGLFGKHEIPVPFIHLETDKLWGASAMIFSEFKELAGL